jgi:hypothetical protein
MVVLRQSDAEVLEKLKFWLFEALAKLLGPPSPKHQEQEDQSNDSNDRRNHCIPSIPLESMPLESGFAAGLSGGPGPAYSERM